MLGPGCFFEFKKLVLLSNVTIYSNFVTPGFSSHFSKSRVPVFKDFCYVVYLHSQEQNNATPQNLVCGTVFSYDYAFKSYNYP